MTPGNGVALKVLTGQGWLEERGKMKEISEPLPCTKSQKYTESWKIKGTHLPTPENMVPHGSASKVNMEISKTTLHPHQTVPVAQK